jgi:hypothetical protein
MANFGPESADPFAQRYGVIARTTIVGQIIDQAQNTPGMTRL